LTTQPPCCHDLAGAQAVDQHAAEQHEAVVAQLGLASGQRFSGGSGVVFPEFDGRQILRPGDAAAGEHGRERVGRLAGHGQVSPKCNTVVRFAGIGQGAARATRWKAVALIV
jgi:hypothetical protein